MPGSRPKLACAAPPDDWPEHPTRQSIESIKLAEEESRLARSRKGPSEESKVVSIATLDSIGGFDDDPSGVESLLKRDERITVLRQLYADGDIDGALAVAQASDAPPSDPFGGLIPVEEPKEAVDPGLEAGLPIIVAPAREPSGFAPPPDEPRSVTSVVPRMLVGAADVAKLPMDPRAAFLLGSVDGTHSVEEILDICAMPEEEALDLLEKLAAMGVIALG
jgi:hypothetical protein